MINRKPSRWFVAPAVATGFVALALALGGGLSATASANGETSEGPDVAITGAALDRASTAALDHLGEGKVTDTEVGDEESYYEVEVTLGNGTEVDVQLDASFAVVGSEADDPSSD